MSRNKKPGDERTVAFQNAAKREAPSNNWEFKIVCRDCGAVLIVESVSMSVDRFESGSRMALLTIPNECPDCHNLRVVKEPNERP